MWNNWKVVATGKIEVLGAKGPRRKTVFMDFFVSVAELIKNSEGRWPGVTMNVRPV